MPGSILSPAHCRRRRPPSIVPLTTESKESLIELLAFFVFFCGNFLPSTIVAQEKITYDDQVTPILRNNCFKCHNPDKTKGDLDLTTYSGVLKGGGSGKAVMPGDAPGSKLYKAIARTEEPFMPANGPKLAEAEIELIRKWIAGGLLAALALKTVLSLLGARRRTRRR